jgi:hypothetical protein
MMTKIPAVSVLNAHIRKGTEGFCVGCKQSITSHYGHRGIWLGCQSQRTSQDAVLMLVPVVVKRKK